MCSTRPLSPLMQQPCNKSSAHEDYNVTFLFNRFERPVIYLMVVLEAALTAAVYSERLQQFHHHTC